MAAYVRAIRERYPRLDIYAVDVEPAGQQSHILVVNESIIFKFPRATHGVQQLRKEAVLLQGLRGRLPLPVPDPVSVNLDSMAVGTAFVGYMRIACRPLLRDTLLAQSDAAQDAIAHQLAQFLQALHDTTIDELDLGLPIEDTHQQWADFYTRVVEHLFPFMRPDSRRLVAGHSEPYLEVPGRLTHVPVLRHGDFGPGNILFDTRTSSVGGVIDFGSAAVGDPALDVASMLGPFGYGEEFVRPVVDAYPVLQPALVRARFYAGTFALQEALWGMDHEDHEAFERGIAAYR